MGFLQYMIMYDMLEVTMSMEHLPVFPPSGHYHQELPASRYHLRAHCVTHGDYTVILTTSHAGFPHIPPPPPLTPAPHLLTRLPHTSVILAFRSKNSPILWLVPIYTAYY